MSLELPRIDCSLMPDSDPQSNRIAHFVAQAHSVGSDDSLRFRVLVFQPDQAEEKSTLEGKELCVGPMCKLKTLADAESFLKAEGQKCFPEGKFFLSYLPDGLDDSNMIERFNSFKNQQTH